MAEVHHEADMFADGARSQAATGPTTDDDDLAGLAPSTAAEAQSTEHEDTCLIENRVRP